MNIDRYMKIIKDIKADNDIKWDDKIATLAIYRLIQQPAIKDYYDSINLKKVKGEAVPYIVVEDSKIKNTIIGEIQHDESLPKFEMYPFGNLRGEIRNFITNEEKIKVEQLKNIFLNSNSFSELVTNMDISLIKQVGSYFKYNIRSLFDLVVCEKESSTEATNQLAERIDLTLTTVQHNYKGNSIKQNALSNFLNTVLKNDLSIESCDDSSYVEALFNLLHYDNYKINQSFVDSSSNNQYNYILTLSSNSQLKNNTLFGATINSDELTFTSNIIDNLVFDTVKNQIIFQSKLISKESTLEDLYNQYPIVDEIINKAIKESPDLIQDPCIHFKHNITRDIESKSEINFISNLDKFRLYSRRNYQNTLNHAYNKLEIKPQYCSVIPSNDFVRFTGTDNYHSYYMLIGSIMPIKNTDSKNNHSVLDLDLMAISSKLNDEQVKQAFDNVFFFCKENTLMLSLSAYKFVNNLGERNLNILNEVREKYKGIVVCFSDDFVRNSSEVLINLNMPLKEIAKIEATVIDLSLIHI